MTTRRLRRQSGLTRFQPILGDQRQHHHPRAVAGRLRASSLHICAGTLTINSPHMDVPRQRHRQQCHLSSQPTMHPLALARDHLWVCRLTRRQRGRESESESETTIVNILTKQVTKLALQTPLKQPSGTQLSLVKCRIRRRRDTQRPTARLRSLPMRLRHHLSTPIMERLRGRGRHLTEGETHGHLQDINHRRAACNSRVPGVHNPPKLHKRRLLPSRGQGSSMDLARLKLAHQQVLGHQHHPLNKVIRA